MRRWLINPNSMGKGPFESIVENEENAENGNIFSKNIFNSSKAPASWNLKIVWLTVCHSVTTFDILWEKPFENIAENVGNQHFFLFTQFYLPYERQI